MSSIKSPRLHCFAVAVLLISVTCPDSTAQCKVRINGTEVTDNADLTVSPGLPNVLSLHLDSREKNLTGVMAILRKVLPDGTVRQQEGHLSSGDVHEFVLGPMTAPPQFVFEAGTVFRVGYRIELVVKEENKRVLWHKQWSQGLGTEPVPWRIGPRRLAPQMLAGPERFVAGGDRRVLFNPKLAVETPLGLRLDDAVLTDQDNVRALFRLTPGALVEELRCRLRLTDSCGGIQLDQPVSVKRSESWQSLPITVAGWPAGNYRVALYPEIDGRLWPEGPILKYRRRVPEEDLVRISPTSPWILRRDLEREALVIRDFHKAVDEYAISLPRGWTTKNLESGSALVSRRGTVLETLELSLPLEGLFAVFAVPHAHGCFIRVGPDPLVRAIDGPSRGRRSFCYLDDATPKEVFIAVADLTNDPIRLFAPDNHQIFCGGLASLRLTPVTAESARTFRKATTELPVPLYGVNDWWFNFWPNNERLPQRMARDQFDRLVGGQAELGVQTIDWDIGRSCVYYDSQLTAVPRFFDGILDFDVLSEVFRCRRRYGTQIRAWHALMYYGASKSETRNMMFRDHPRYRRWRKNATAPDDGKHGGQLLSLYFPEVRRHKVDALLEVAEAGADGVVVGTVRLPPLMCYHPDMVAEYRSEFGVDPLRIDASREDAYTHWITWRADYFTQLLREVREKLRAIERKQSRRISVAVRIPSTGLYWNLAQGMDVRQWLREGLVDQLQLVALETRGGRECNSHDIQPYVELARRYGVPVVGGLGYTWLYSPEAYPATLRRALGLLHTGADGLEFYGGEHLPRCSWYSWLVPLFGQPDLLRDFLAESNLEACYPIVARTALYGYDNHSRWFVEDGGAYVWDVYGLDGDSL